MSEKSLIIIGAGIAGLSAGCFGQMNGYRTAIFEMHDRPGGLCTGWQRKGYTFDGCIHWLMGTGKDSPYRPIWEELGALHGRACVHHDEFVRIVEPDGKTLIAYTNIDRLERHLLELSPADAGIIHELTGELRRFTRFEMMADKPRELMNLLDGAKLAAKMLPFMPALSKWASMPMAVFAQRFQDHFLRRAFPLIFGAGEMPMLMLLVFLSNMHNGDSGYPIGGSLEFARAIERRYLDLGGQMHYRARVAQILVEDGRAVGIRLVDGTEHRADVVISAADGHATLFDMLGGQYLTDEIRHYYADYPIFHGVVQVSLGIARDLSAEPHSTAYVLEKPVMVGGESRPAVSIKHYCYDPSLAPAGKSVVEALFSSDHAFWKGIANDQERYEAEKQQAATAVIDVLEARYPGITRDIEVVDVATPLTTERYTGNWQGSIEGWFPDANHWGEMMKNGMKRTLPGLDGFYMIGQWVQPGGGLPGVAPTGREVIQILCHEDRQEFETTKVA